MYRTYTCIAKKVPFVIFNTNMEHFILVAEINEQFHRDFNENCMSEKKHKTSFEIIKE